MSGRALIAIGCNSYEHLPTLTGAEADAAGIYDTLIRPEIGDYDTSRSRILRSPLLQEVRDALTAILFSGEALDTLTISFAGHGEVSGGSFYMALRDSRRHALSVTALSLADLFRMIAEAAPKQTYLIIDACQSGGLIADLNVILKSEVMGELGTPGVTLLATAASNEAAVEIGGHGLGTTALLQCVRGEIFLQDSNPALDLVEIGRAVSQRLSDAGEQTPVVWGLNLYGPSSFSKNPHVGTGNAPLRSVLAGWPDAKSAAAIRSSLPRLWEPYVALSRRWEPREFVDRLSPLLDQLQDDPSVLLNLNQRISEACAAQAQEARDRFRAIEVQAACIVALLPYSSHSAVADQLVRQCTALGLQVEATVHEVIAAVEAYKFALVTGGLGDLYDLPIRLSKLLGWSGFAIHVRLLNGDDPGPAKIALSGLLAKIWETYSLSLVAMSDIQAPFLIAVVTACVRVDLLEDAEQLLGHYFASAVSCGGKIARADLDPSKVLSYLVARSKPPIELGLDVLAQPTELVLALLRLSRLVNLSEEFDLALFELDHLALNAYLPDDYLKFGDEHVADGVNAVFNVGHDFWSVADLEAAWPAFPYPPNAGTLLASLLASLIFPDRCSWFLLPIPSLVEGGISEKAAVS
ncbi:caspase family protein [Sphingosinicella xenopeptidilytica]|uniref:Caspase domain-containing protein n=1 Tax=Sphingosinicella xenopeptidilytica TaxID=364098 RepID=A0ABW3C4H9_SPHXN